jgi:hypothetical protein
MPHYIMIFDKSDESFVGREQLSGISLPELKSIFPESENDPKMIYVYDVSEDVVDLLSKYVKVEFDFEEYDYQLSYRE